jgi:hypothetical protein
LIDFCFNFFAIDREKMAKKIGSVLIDSSKFALAYADPLTSEIVQEVFGV